MNEAVIVSSVRTAVGKAGRGTLKDVRPEHLGAVAIKGALERVPGLDPMLIEDVIIGCAMPEGEQGMNMGRIVALKAGLPVDIPAMTVNRFCSSGLQTIALAAERIMAGSIDVAIAGGVESMSMIPMTGVKFAPDPDLAEEWPDVYLGMGLTAENVVKKYGISREDQDAFALKSHKNAAAAIQNGRFEDEIVPVPIEATEYKNGKQEKRSFEFKTDEGPRADTSLEALAKLRPAFSPFGTVTAGNSSQRSDGAAAAVVMSRKKAEELGLKPLATFRGFAVGGVEPEIMGMGPVKAIPKVIEKSGIKLDDIDVIELNEAFAAQALAVIREVGLNPEKVNVNGGAIALGHPLGCTGAKLTATILREMERRKARYGMVTMCIGGGMGAAGIFEMN
ncbi:MAG: thiolase family protein [Candidatus Omnitrophica bacterium]|nr:thiolase family protein [Candidatus Omnitrophota bacterium]